MSLFTIITVCYNAEKEIKRTIESVLNQTFCDYEYLIVDGLSKDSTVKIAESYKTAFQKKGIIYKINSEKDTGIYNAMNKGTDMSDGKWLIFLNAGDTLADKYVLEKTAVYDCNDVAILYGDVIYSICKRLKKFSAKPLIELKNGMVFCHQSAYIRKNKMKEYRYDETFQIGADYDFISRCYNNNEKIAYIPVTVSVFELGGTSSNPVEHMLEQLEIQKKNRFITEKEYQKKVRYWLQKENYYRIRKIIEKCMPKMIINYLRQKKYEKLGYKKFDEMH